MSTKTKNNVGRTVGQKVQPKTKTSSSDNKLESSRNVKETKRKSDLDKLKNVKEKTELKTPKQNATGTQSSDPISKNKQKTVPKSLPSSNRITKTKFFPTKNNYGDLLQNLDKYHEVSGAGTPRQTSQTLRKKTNEVVDKRKKETKNSDSFSESNSLSERPRTSTLRKGSIVNHNIAGPEIPKETISINKSKVSKKDTEEKEYEEYEDDFETYESDFESCSSSDSTIHNISEIASEDDTSSITSSSNSNGETEDKGALSANKEIEKKLDSGNFDLNENKKKQSEFVDFQDLIEKDNMKMKIPENKSSHTSLSDEGFEELKSLQYLNFAKAKEKFEKQKFLELKKKRGDHLMTMIKLDVVSFTIFDMNPIPYEEFIKVYGNVNSVQIGIQTGEENVDDEMQTEEIETCAKWTQMPPHISKVDSNFYKYEKLGVGPDFDQNLDKKEDESPSFNQRNLEKFLSSAGGLVLDILKEQMSLSGEMKNNSPVDSFSDGFVQFKPPLEFLEKRKISSVSFFPCNPSVFLSVHIDNCNADDMKSVIFLWNINDIFPEMYLVCYGKIKCCCFGSNSNTIFAGLENGILAVWDTKENISQIKNMYSMIEDGVLLRGPSFLTEIDNSHSSSIVAIQSVVESNKCDIYQSEVESTKQVCSLDQEGDIIVWGVITKNDLEIKGNKGLAHWGRIMLYKNFRVSLSNLLPEIVDLSCTDMVISKSEPVVAFIITNYGYILHCTLNKERTSIKLHVSEDSSPAKSLTMCPFSGCYFLAGFENGNINLYSEKNKKALMIISKKETDDSNNCITNIQWSSEKPCTFYTKNAENTIDVWDLSKSHIFPLSSVSFKDTITCMKISPPSNIKNEVYMMISTETAIHMHLLNRNHTSNNEEYQKEMRSFMNYVSRL